MEWLPIATTVAKVLKTVLGRLFGSRPAESGDSQTASSVGESSRVAQVGNSPSAITVLGDLNIYPPRNTGQSDLNVDAPISGIGSDGNEVTSRVDKSIDSPLLSEKVAGKVHSTLAEQQLSEILSIRVLHPPSAQNDIEVLYRRVGIGGEFQFASQPVKNRIHYWAARILAASPETLSRARGRRDELHQMAPEMDLSIIDSLVAEADGDHNAAITLLRDHEKPDSRSALFSLLARSKSKEDALTWCREVNRSDEPQFFTDIGWRAWAICMIDGGHWRRAAKRLSTLGLVSAKTPALALVEGIINAAMLLPEDLRSNPFQAVPISKDVAPVLGPNAEQYHARATLCFGLSEAGIAAADDTMLSRFYSDWCLWLRLMNPQKGLVQSAREEIRLGMERGKDGVRLILFAWAFRVSFEPEPLVQHLAHRRKYGGLDQNERIAEFLLAEKLKSSIDFSEYIRENYDKLCDVISASILGGMYVEAMLKDNRLDEARSFMEANVSAMEQRHLDRLLLMLDSYEGKDTGKQLNDLYQDGKRLVDLKNLISYKKAIGDWAELLPLVKELFTRQRTIENANEVVACLVSDTSDDSDAIIDFLDANSDLVERSDDLQQAKAVALFRASKFDKAKAMNDRLLQGRNSEEDFHLDIRIAISTGHWERISDVIDREWRNRDSLAPEFLMTLAQLAAQGYYNVDRALQLARLAVLKAPDDARVLAAAYWLHFQVGRDSEADPDWVMRASTLSSGDEGPVWRVDMKEFFADIPKRRQHLRELDRRWLQGEIPISLAAGQFNVSMARLLLHIPRTNENLLDGRTRTMLPIVSGNREAIALQDTWTVAFDTTSVMVLSHLGLLQKAFATFDHIRLAPDAMELLFHERAEVRFHQPSRVQAAKELVDLRDTGKLRVAKNLVRPPHSITDEVGYELAELLHTAKRDDGIVVCVLPIHKVGSFPDQDADTTQYADIIHSAVDFVELLHSQGKIGGATYEKASSHLQAQGQQERSGLPASAITQPIFLDGLALSYFQSAGVLRPLAATGLDIRLHPNVLREMAAIVGEDDTGAGLAASIDSIREELCNAMECGNASFLPRVDEPIEELAAGQQRFQSTAFLFAASSHVDAVCIDDRFVNCHPRFRDPLDRQVPIICIMDILRHLLEVKHIDSVKYWGIAHALRQGGFVFIPLEPKELVHWLKLARFNEDELTESVELRTIRQTIARSDSLDLANEAEAIALTGYLTTAGREAIVDLWRDANVSPERAAALSDWVWRNLLSTAVFGRRHLAQDAYAQWIREMIASSLACLLLPLEVQSQDRVSAYSEWMERSILEPLRRANVEVIEKALNSARAGLLSVKIDHRPYGHMFLQQLPEATRRVAIQQDPEFARECGIERRRIFGLAPNVDVEDRSLFTAAGAALESSSEQTTYAIDGRPVSITPDAERRTILLKWSDNDSNHEIFFPELSLVSPDGEVRLQTLKRMVDRIGTTGTELYGFLSEVESRSLSSDEISDVFEHSNNGVAALQGKFIQRIRDGLSLGFTDIVPQSVRYLERFAGPLPDTLDVETYILDSLIPYRKQLLHNDLRTGFDLCSLGALRDDLTPGQWLIDADHDAILEAVLPYRETNSPFHLLAIIDIGLYRADDKRFEKLVRDCIGRVLDHAVNQDAPPDPYRVLAGLSELVLNHINLMERAATYPPFWKRMCAWMQAGFVARVLGDASNQINVSGFHNLAEESMRLAGAYSEMVGTRTEPLVYAKRVSPTVLQREILSRLQLLSQRHQHEGRSVPGLEDIDSALANIEARGETFALWFPGPLEAHKVPTRSIPPEISTELMSESPSDDGRLEFRQFATVSQFFALGDVELKFVRSAVKMIAERGSGSDVQKDLRYLDAASIVASGARDQLLADGIKEAILKFVPRVSSDEEVFVILQVLLQTAGAFEAEDTWYGWLGRQLSDLAYQLPAPPSNALQVLVRHLDSIGTILPVERSFVVHARSIASSGAT